MKLHSSDKPMSTLSTRLMIAAVFVGVALLTLVFVVGRAQWLVWDEVRQTEERAVAPAPDLVELRAREDSVLATSEVLDSVSGLYRIPIERAMELIASEQSK